MKPCPLYPGYSVDEFGNVYTHRRRRKIKGKRGGTEAYVDPLFTKTMSPNRNEKGYLSVRITGPSGIKRVMVHTLVLETFAGPRPAGMEARHLDGNPGNNSMWNLAWGTPQQNAQDKFSHGTMPCGERSCNAKLTNAQAEQIRKLRSTGSRVKALAAQFNVSVPTIESVIYGKTFKTPNHLKIVV
jgi:hypothetical protein